LAIVSKTSGEDDEGFGALIHRIQVGLGSMWIPMMVMGNSNLIVMNVSEPE